MSTHFMPIPCHACLCHFMPVPLHARPISCPSVPFHALPISRHAISCPSQFSPQINNSCLTHFMTVPFHAHPISCRANSCPHNFTKKEAFCLFVCCARPAYGFTPYPTMECLYRFNPRAAERPILGGQPALSSWCCHHLIRFFPFPS